MVHWFSSTKSDASHPNPEEGSRRDNADADGQAALFEDYEAHMRAWSEESGVPLSASYGCAAHAEFPDKRITELARTADDRMYAAKAAYYRTSGRERRRFRAEAPV